MNDTTPTTPVRHRRLVAVGAVAAGISVACAGGAMAVSPGSPVSRTISGALQSIGWQAGPAPVAVEPVTAPEPDAAAAVAVEPSEEPTTFPSDALWDAGYTWGDAQHLAELWGLEMMEAKARAGQALLDGQTLPITPGTYPEAGADPESVAADAFWRAGYTFEDAEQLAALWEIESWETKIRAGQALLDGQTLPVPPSGVATSGS